MTAHRWLAVAAIAYSVMHHEGTLLGGLGETVEDTRWADWVDILTPYLVLLPVAAALHALRADKTTWITYLVGAITYVEGHGMHLSANSVGNVEPKPAGAWPDIVHFWDEVMGHYVWYAGVALVVVAVARAAHDQPAPPAVAHVLAVLVGITHFTNNIEGGTPVFGLAVAAGLAAVGFVHRRGFGRAVLVAYATAFVLLAGFGVWQGGFPQFTELGWV